MFTPSSSLRSIVTLLLLLLATSQAVPAANLWEEKTDLATIYDNWFGATAPPMSEQERESVICIASAASVGGLITLVGGTAIVVAGTVGGATGTAIALPVLVSSMWSACSMGKAIAPGMTWLHNRSKTLVQGIGDAVNNALPANLGAK